MHVQQLSAWEARALTELGVRKEEDARKQREQVQVRRPKPGSTYDLIKACQKALQSCKKSQAPQEQKCEAEFRERDHLVQAEVRWLG